MNKTKIEVGTDADITIENIGLISEGKAKLCLSHNQYFLEKIERGACYVENKLALTGQIYGVTTGYGEDCTKGINFDLVNQLPVNLTRFHGCGLGEFLTPAQTRAVLAVRLVSLCRGVSGVSLALLERLALLLELDILPLIPSEGSVGASGDLTPLSYVAGVIIGERSVYYQGQIRPAAEVLKELSIQPYKLRPKEALALMNGTAVMTALAIEAYRRAEYLVSLSSRITAMTSLALRGNPEHFDPYLFAMKPHPGQEAVASFIYSDLAHAPKHYPTDRLQDRYSTRCAPHVIGVLADMLPTFKKIIETELNSANDNPLIDISDNENAGRFLHGGHFYGGHIAFVMDSIKNLVANIADLLDRQMATLVDVKFNHGLPANLSGMQGPQAAIHHGLKAVQIAASAWTAEALKNTMPASVFSRSTESHNQDKVSMGTIAARDALRVLQLTEQVTAAQLLATTQALRLRIRDKELSTDHFSTSLHEFYIALKKSVPFVQEDQPLDDCLRALVLTIQSREWRIYGDRTWNQ